MAPRRPGTLGGATGGVVNVLTKSGSNQFHGQGGTYYQNDGMQGDIRPTNRKRAIDGDGNVVARTSGELTVEQFDALLDQARAG